MNLQEKNGGRSGCLTVNEGRVQLIRAVLMKLTAAPPINLIALITQKEHIEKKWNLKQTYLSQDRA